MQVEQTERLDVPNADSVLKFLTRNPDFFNQHEEVLPRLAIPHETGQAVSLIEKQVSVLRNKCCTLENSLRDLINVARENEQLHQRLHTLIQEIITASSLEDIAKLTCDNLLTNFSADEVRLVLVSDKPQDDLAPACVFLEDSDSALELFSEIFESGETRCGELSDEQKKVIFGDDAETEEVASAALIPLVHNRKLGFVVLSSKDESRFAVGKGVMFLNQLGEMLSRRIDTLI